MKTHRPIALAAAILVFVVLALALFQMPSRRQAETPLATETKDADVRVGGVRHP